MVRRLSNALKCNRLLLSMLLTACGAAVAVPATATAAIRKGPYLVYPGDPTTMQVLWQTGATEPCTIEWGTDTACTLGSVATAEFGTDHQHGFTLTDLVPDGQYFYRVVNEGMPFTGSFRTAPPVRAQDQAPPVRFFAYGDTRTNPAVHDRIAGQMLRDIEADPLRQSVIISVGDLVTNGDSEALWDDDFFSDAYPNLHRLLAELPYQSCMGNHEGTGAVFTKYFPYPYVAHRYWSFDYGPAHFAMVDQYADYAPGSDQYAWLQNDLAATDRSWIFVVLHEPGWSAGGGHANSTGVQQHLQPLFVEYGVSIVFGGHNHYYARAVVDGVQHLTVGGGGAPLYAPDPAAPNVVASARANHYCRITLDDRHLTFAAVNGAALLDTFSLDSRTGADQPPVPESLILHPPSPNPFNPMTTIRFDLPADGEVRLGIFDAGGHLVRSLVDGSLTAGRHQASWDGRDAEGRHAASGSYFARLEAQGGTQTRWMSLVR